MISRKMSNKLVEALNNFRVVMLNGPRQSGKTTLVKSLSQSLNMDYITLDEPDKLQFAQIDPATFLDFYAKKPLIIDEIQFAPELIPYIKTRVDNTNTKGLFLLTGSADFMRMHKITESLAGRMVRYNLYPLANAEIKNKSHNIIDALFNLFSQDGVKLSNDSGLEKVIERIIVGGYPEIVTGEKTLISDWFESYLEARVQKDILEYKHISLSKLKVIRSLLKLLASYDAQIINYYSIGKKLQISNKTVLSYVELLEAMYIIKTVPSYHTNSALKVIKSPKIHFIDTGLACHLLNVNSERLFLKKDSSYGGLIENFVYSELLKQATYSKTPAQIYHFRDLRKKEVDLVLENRDGNIIGIEVKAKASIHKKDLKGMHALANASQENFLNGFIFYGGKEIKPIANDGRLFYCLPLGLLC